MIKKLLLNVLALHLFFSCTESRIEENAPQSTISQNIIGSWKVDQKESNGVNVPISSSCPDLGSFTFNTDKTLIEKLNSTVNNVCLSETDNYTYLIDESLKKITATNAQNDQLVYTIYNLTENQLILLNIEGIHTNKFTLVK